MTVVPFTKIYTILYLYVYFFSSTVVPGAGGVLSVVNSYAQTYLPPTSPAASRAITHHHQGAGSHAGSHFPQAATSPPAALNPTSVDTYAALTAAAAAQAQQNAQDATTMGYVQAASPQPTAGLTGLAVSK